MSKAIILSQHAKQQLEYRGATEAEIVEALQTSKWMPAELGRLECKKDFVYNKTWNSKHYKIKQVRPIFVEENDKVIVVTVYTYYS